jgi:hypothetical protein
MPKIWYRASKDAYYLQIDRDTQKRLGKTKPEAEAAYRTWLIEQGEQLPAVQRKKLTIAEAAQEFLSDAQAHTKPKTYEFYCYFIVPFVERFGAATTADFSPLAFAKWLDANLGCKGSCRNATVAVKRLFNWCVEKKLVAESPLRGVNTPRKKRRKRFLSGRRRPSCSQLSGTGTSAITASPCSKPGLGRRRSPASAPTTPPATAPGGCSPSIRPTEVARTVSSTSPRRCGT